MRGSIAAPELVQGWGWPVLRGAWFTGTDHPSSWPSTGKANLVLRIHGYLQRYGFLNFGLFSRVNPMHGM